MASFAVSVQNVSKKYRLFNSPKERLLETLHPFKKKYHREFWALKDINLDIQKGMTIGIIGRNGSGKSTLLQIICSVLRPTSGTLETNGRISALLALGAGFNSEFTGRDNVLMNGALMGFSKAEMKKRMPTIESFADIGEFIDQPMKIYSSGMSLRLAFAAAINVDPDILVVDEALAVGDAKFQHKCYGKFLEFQEVGKTIIFVTHDTNAIIRHCDQAILLEKGQIIEIGEPKTIANYYVDLLFTGEVPSYSSLPNLIESDFNGFNIVQYRKKYYGFSLSLGSIDVSRLWAKDLERYTNEGKCVVGSSLEEVKQFLESAILTTNESLNQKRSVPTDKIKKMEAEIELEKFLKEIPTEDNCVYRKSYNKNEHRIQTGKAVIIDYLLVAGNKGDAVSVSACEKVDLYFKVKFNEDIAEPVVSVGVRTLDGVILYATNTVFDKVILPPAKRGSVLNFCYSLKLSVQGGDYFIGLDCSQKISGEIVHLDRRSSLIHIKIEQDKMFGGLVSFESASRII